MQVLENEIQGKPLALRASGERGELLIKYPPDLARTLGLKAGTRFTPFFNHRGEVLFRPMSEEVAPEGQAHV